MSKKNNIEIENIKITSSPKFLIGIISVTFIVAIHFFTFLNMKKELSENTQIIKSTEQKISDQEVNFNKEVVSLKIIMANLQGRLNSNSIENPQ